jgi:hypothetical protein
VTTSRARAVAAAAGVLVLVPSLAACGGDDKAAAEKPAEATTSATPSSSSATPTPTPTPSPTLRPLSRFEDRVQVEVARKWAAAAAKSSSADDKTMSRIKPFVTPSGLTKMQGYFAEDIGKLFPGPVPFTPINVRVEGGTAKVPMCMWTGGFAVDPKTKKPTDARRIDAGVFLMVRSGGKWKINDMVYAPHDCSKVVVKGRAF